MAATDAAFYTAPDDFLQQGDIFELAVVGPEADLKDRIFRSKDGRHGSVVFEENCDATVFDAQDLADLLVEVPRTRLHTDPFQKTQDGQHEMVVAFARRFRYFVIASQTCDVAGQDNKAPLPYVVVLPGITLAEICQNDPLPLGSAKNQAQMTTIHEFVTRRANIDEVCPGNNPHDYPSAVRGLVADMAKGQVPKAEKEQLGQIRNYLSNYFKPLCVSSLPPGRRFGIPEGLVDFTAVYTVPTEKLAAVRDRRVARIGDPYRDQFAQKFGYFFSRIATLVPMQPDTAS